MEKLLHCETRAVLKASVAEAFAYLDDFRKLSAHMERPSAMMAGSRMTIEMDATEGRQVGSRVSMRGSMLGMSLALEETVTLREPPFRKAWRTVSTDLLVIGDYELGFELEESGAGAALRVFINYELPAGGLSRWLGRLFGARYARWCTERMAADAALYFADR